MHIHKPSRETWSTLPPAPSRRARLQRLLAWTVAIAAFALWSGDAQAQILFTETFGSTNAQLPTATSTADGSWVSASCLNGQIVGTGGDSPSDNDTGSTHYLFQNTAACPYAANEAVWRSASPIAVQPNTTYLFSYWIRPANLINPPNLTQRVMPDAGTITILDTTTPALTTGSWVRRSLRFTTAATTTSVTLSITNTVTTAGGNDFGIDDVALQQLQPPLLTCTPAETRATERFWFFGASAGIDFGVSGATATPIAGGQTGIEGTTVVTDTSGQLLFWSNGLAVYNRLHQPMPNGTGLLGNFSATQTVAAFPSLTQTGVYFVVSTSGASEVGGTGELYYSVVDMSLDGGLGDVTAIKNVQLGPTDASSEALTAVPNADGTGFWVLTATANSPNILAYAFDGDGPVTGSPVVSPMSTNNGNAFGTFNFSADLTQLVQQTGHNSGTAQVRLLSFDAANGQVSERFTWNLPTGPGTGNQGYSADFSPNADYVYVTRIFGGQLYRYRIAGATTAAEVVATMEQLGGIGPNGGQVKRAPDGRMYVANVNQTTLSVVTDPDNATDPGFAPVSYALAPGTSSRWGLPQTVTGCPVPLPPDVQIVKSVNQPSVTPGTNFTYTLAVTNNGSVDAHNAVTTDVLPSQVTFVSAPAACTASGQTVTCTEPVLAAGATVTYAIVVLLDPAYSGDGSDILNSASVDIDEEDPLPKNNISPPGAPPVGPALADVAIVKDVSADEVVPGGQFKYSILVSNQGPSAATNVQVTDTLPAPVHFLSSPQGCTAAGQNVTCPAIASMNPGASATFVVYVELDANYRGDGQDLPNAAGVTSGTGDPVPGNNTNPPVFPRVGDPLSDIAVAAAVSKLATVPGDVLTATFTAQNLGPQDATGVIAHVTLPATATLIGAPPAGYNAGTGQWTVGALANGVASTLTLQLRVANAGALPVVVQRTAVDQVDANPGNDTATAALTSKQWSTFEADLVINGDAFPTAAQRGEVLTYRLTAVNRGPTYVVDLRIEGAVPAGTTFESLTPSAGGACATPAPGGTGPLTCTWLGATLLDAGASRTAQLQVRVPADAVPGSSITGAFQVRSQAAEYYEPSNHAIITTAVADGTPADLALSALMRSDGVLGTALPLPLGVPTPMRFTVTNQGPTMTASALYTVSVPESDIGGLQILRVDVSQGAVGLTGVSSANWQIGPLGPGESARFDLTVAMRSMRATSLVMRRAASQPGDPNSANDTATLILDGTGHADGGERTTTVANLDGAGLKEILVGAGRLETPQVRVFTGTGQDTGIRFYAYDRNFPGGVHLASCDIDGDGQDEVVTGPGIGPGPHVRVLRVSAQIVDEVVGFYAFDPAFAGGVSVACADVDADGRAEVVAAMETGGGEVRVFDVGPGSVVQVAAFQAYEDGFSGGVRVAALSRTAAGGDHYQIVTLPGPGRALEARAWTLAGATASLARTVAITGASYQLGGFVGGVTDVDGDGQLDVVVATDRGIGALVGAFTVDSGHFVGSYSPYGASFLGGARLSLGDIDGNGVTELIVSPGTGGRPIVDVLTLSRPPAALFRFTSVEIP